MDESLITELQGLTDLRGITRYRALADGLADAIRSGRLAVDDRLPAERGLANSIGVSRNTVVAAYEELRDRGLVRTRPGSGTVVEPGASPVASPREAWLVGALRPGMMLDRLVAPSKLPVDLRAGGAGDATDLPADLLSLVAGELAANASRRPWEPAGLPALREGIAQHLTRTGLPTTSDQVLVTSGAQQATSLVVRSLVSPGATVAVEELTSAGVMAALTVAEADIRGVRLTAQGIDVAALVRTVDRHRPVLVHLSSSVQQPTGTVMPVAAQRQLALAAEGWRTVVIDDRSRSMLQFRGEPPPPLASFAAPGGSARIITIGSLSRVAWPGLRIGWLRADQPTSVERLVRLRAADDLGVSVPSQILAIGIMERLPELAAQRRRLLTDRYHHLVRTVGNHLPQLRLEATRGGWIVPIRLPHGRASRLAAIARTTGVEVLPASVAAVGDVADDRLLLSLAVSDDVQSDGLARLGQAWRSYELELRRDGDPRRRADVAGLRHLAPPPRGLEAHRPPT